MNKELELKDCLRMKEDGTLFLESFTQPGGYPVLYYDAYGNIMCPECATRNFDIKWPADGPTGAFIYWEGPPVSCTECYEETASAYTEGE